MKTTFLLSGLFALGMIRFLTGCAEEKPAPKPDQVGGVNRHKNPQGGSAPPVIKTGGGGDILINVFRTKDKLKIENDLNQMAKLYLFFNNDRGKSPASDKEFAEYIKRDSNEMYQWIVKDKFYGIVPGARTDSNSVVVYTTAINQDDVHLVAHGDGHPGTISQDELKKLLKNP